MYHYTDLIMRTAGQPVTVSRPRCVDAVTCADTYHVPSHRILALLSVSDPHTGKYPDKRALGCM